MEASFKRCKGVSSSFVGVPARLFLATAAATPTIRPTLNGSALRASRVSTAHWCAARVSFSLFVEIRIFHERPCKLVRVYLYCHSTVSCHCLKPPQAVSPVAPGCTRLHDLHDLHPVAPGCTRLHPVAPGCTATQRPVVSPNRPGHSAPPAPPRPPAPTPAPPSLMQPTRRTAMLWVNSITLSNAEASHASPQTLPCASGARSHAVI